MRFSVKRDCEKSRILSLHFRDSCNEEILWIITLSDLPTNNNFVTMHRKNIFHVAMVTLPPKFPGICSTCCCIPRHLVCSPQTSPENREYRVKNINIDDLLLYTCTHLMVVLDRKKTWSYVLCYDTVAMLYAISYGIGITLKTVDMIETRQFTVGCLYFSPSFLPLFK